MHTRPFTPVPPPAARERRSGVRVHLRAEVVLDGGTDWIRGRVRNLSTGGMYVETSPGLPTGTPVVVESLLWEDGTAHRLHLDGWVAHADADGMGIRFDPPDDRAGKLLTRLIGRFLVGR